jgi:sugar phosphate isomerase/epimerase
VRFSVGQYTTPRLSFAEDLAVYREAGAEGVGIDASLKITDVDEDLARFRDSGMQATFCMPSTSTVFAGKIDKGLTDPVARVDAMCDAVREMARFEPVCVVLGTGPFSDVETDRPFAVESLRRVVRVAAGLGQSVALEPLHTSLGPEWSYLTDLPGTLKLIEDIGEPDVGVLFDVWHLWDTPDIKDVLAANVETVYGVHVDDWRSPTRSWADRVLPGDGIGDAAGLLAILRAGGYDGWLELEVFSDDGFMEQEFPDSLWREDPVELIRRGRERTLDAWNADRSTMGAG